MEPYAEGVRRSWMRVKRALGSRGRADRLPLTQLRLASKLASLRNPLPQGERERNYCRNISRATIMRMIWLVPSRIEWTRKSRQKRSIG